jgi:hypothetical protein
MPGACGLTAEIAKAAAATRSASGKALLNAVSPVDGSDDAPDDALRNDRLDALKALETLLRCGRTRAQLTGHFLIRGHVLFGNVELRQLVLELSDAHFQRLLVVRHE